MRSKRRTWGRRAPRLEVGQAVGGIFTATLLDAKAFREGREVVKRRVRFRNLLLDAALNAVAAMANTDFTDLMNSCHVGTGSTAPAAGDLALVSALASTTSSAGFSDVVAAGPAGAAPGAPPEYWGFVRTRVFLEGEANGNLTEVGMASGNHTGGFTMLTRQLFRDEVGNPTTIVKTNAELLRIDYEFRIYVPTAVVTQLQVPIGAQNIDVTIQPVRAAGSSWSNLRMWGSTENVATATGPYRGWALEPNTDHSADFKADPATAGAVVAAPGPVFDPYVSGSFKSVGVYTWDLAQANFATGIGAFLYGAPIGNGVTFPPWYMRFNPKINKTSSDKLRLTVSWTLSRAVIP